MKRFVQFLLVAAGGGAIALHAADPAKIDGYERVGFDRLASYTFTPPDADPAKPEAPSPSGANQIPAKIKALDQQKVAVTGFILPVKMDGGLVKEFLLVKDPMLCCYGVMPKINEWVVVRMVGSGVKPLMDIPITFEGKLHVGEMYDNGYLTGLYLLDGDRQTETRAELACRWHATRRKESSDKDQGRTAADLRYILKGAIQWNHGMTRIERMPEMRGQGSCKFTHLRGECREFPV